MNKFFLFKHLKCKSGANQLFLITKTLISVTAAADSVGSYSGVYCGEKL